MVKLTKLRFPKTWPEGDFWWVLLLGALGGALSYLWAPSAENAQHSESPPLSLLAHLAFGAGAGLVFIYLLANTQRDDLARLCATALLAGFAWVTVWEMAANTIDQKDDQQEVAVEQVEEARSQLAAPAAQEGSNETMPGYLDARITVPGSQVYVEPSSELTLGITVTQEALLSLVVDGDTDLTASLFETGEDDAFPRFVAFSDDYGGSVNPRINEFVSPGSYALVLRSYFEGDPIGVVEITATIDPIQ